MVNKEKKLNRKKKRPFNLKTWQKYQAYLLLYGEDPDGDHLESISRPKGSKYDINRKITAV